MTNCFELSDATLFERNVLGYSMEENRLSAQISTRSIEESNSIRTMVITSPLELVTMGALVHERLSAVGLSEGALNDLLSAFSSRFGIPRSKALETVIFWHAGLPVPPGSEIELLVQWTSSDPTPNNLNVTEKHNKLLRQCLVVEKCAYLLSVTHGDDWYDQISANTTATATADSNCLAIHQIQIEVSAICGFSSHDVVRKEMMNVLMTNQKLRDIQALVTKKTDELRNIRVLVNEKKQLLLEKQQQQQRLQQIEEETAEAANWQRRRLQNLNQQELYLSQNGSNSNKLIRNNLRRLRPSGDDNNERHYNEGTAQNFSAATIAAGNNNNNSYNQNTIESMMQQHCMHQPPFGN
jgi:hypothetical protein